VSRLQTIGAWMERNGESIYGTRPWERFGEGPTRVKEGMHMADRNTDFTAQDLRFTSRNKSLYVHVLGDPGTQVRVMSIRRDTPLPCGSLTKAEMLGSAGTLQWNWSADGLVIQLPDGKPSEDAIVIRLS
jgi:alpha-L-fucosidase